MKKIFFLIFTVLFILTACNNNDTSSSSFGSKTETNEIYLSSDDRITYTYDTGKEKSSLTHFNNEIIEKFLYRGNFYKVDNWIYYKVNRELRKCKPDLTGDILLEQDIYDFYIQNSVLYFSKIIDNDSKEMYMARLDNVNFCAEKIIELKENNNWIIYKNSIIYTKDFTNELMIYDIDKNAEKCIYDDNVAYFSMLDHYVYYNLYDDDAVYRYDINAGKGEMFLEFEKHDNFAPKVYYINNMIIIQVDVNEFVYTDVNNKILRKVLFDVSEYESGWTVFHFIDNENMYFSTAEHYDVVNPLTTPHNIYKIKIGTEQIEFVKEIIGENIGCLTDSYRYYFDESNVAHREYFNN